VARVDVFDAPLDGSPKFQLYAKFPLPEDELLKFTVAGAPHGEVGVPEKLAAGGMLMLMAFVTTLEAEHPSEFVIIRVTLKVPPDI
jgi:hypothetical protein